MWWAVGLALLAALRADTTSLRVALAAPALGSAVVVIPLFMLSDFGVPLKFGGPPVLVAVIAATVIVLLFRRPRLPRPALAVAGIALVHLVIAGRPMIRFGFHWLANANGDMGYYVLSATSLLTSGLRSPVDRVALAHDQDLATVAHRLHEQGVRVGADVVLSSLATTTGRFAADLYMPLILSVSMVGICAVGALAMQFARRARAAVIAAALLAVSPLATYGVVQQLLPQVWGLAIAAALFALLMRPELHARVRPSLAETVPVWILVLALFLVYVELAGSLLVPYGLYLVFLAARRSLSPLSVLRLWGPAVIGLVLVVNLYLPRAIGFATGSAHAGVATVGSRRLFGTSLVPTATAAVAGFQSFAAPPSARFMNVSIVAATLVLGVAVVAAVVTARRGVAASVAIVGDLILGTVLAFEESDFGLFKLYMYVQPFLAAAVGVWIAGIRSRVALAAVASISVVVVAAQARTQAQYVERSTNPTDLRNASSADLLPAFRSLLARAESPIISVTDNKPLIELEGAAASAAGRPLEFLGTDPFELPATQYAFRLATPHRKPVTFVQSRGALALLARDGCKLEMPSGSQHVLNRRQLPEGMPDLVLLDCAKARNLLAFVESSVGQPFYSLQKKDVSFWQLERDAVYPGRTMSGFGRYALLQTINPTPGARLELAYSTTSLRDPSLSFALPLATVTGSRRFDLPVTGVGSARVFSPPLRPQMIDGQPYLLLDMGRSGYHPAVPRPGLTGLWGRSVHLDPRVLTSYIRSISLVSARDYRSMAAPSSIGSFPRDLGNESLEYSGIFEDGWIGRDSYVVLAGAPATSIGVQALVLPRPGGQRLQVLVNGRSMFSGRVKAGPLQLRVPVPKSRGPRKVELRWAGVTRLPAPDLRSAAARLSFLGASRAPTTLRSFPRDLRQVDSKGIFDDGWLARRSYAVLAGGRAATLTLKASVPPRKGGQHLDVLVNGDRVASQDVKPGNLDLTIPLPASKKNRRIELRWAAAIKLQAPDTRHAAALLKLLSVAPAPPAPTSVSRFPDDLTHLDSKGIYRDGWLAADSWAVLAGGRAATLTLKASVPPRKGGQHLDVLVNGDRVASQDVKPGNLDLTIPLPASTKSRRIELRWAAAIKLQAPDTRHAAALLRLLDVSAT